MLCDYCTVQVHQETRPVSGPLGSTVWVDVVGQTTCSGRVQPNLAHLPVTSLTEAAA